MPVTCSTVNACKECLQEGCVWLVGEYIPCRDGLHSVELRPKTVLYKPQQCPEKPTEVNGNIAIIISSVLAVLVVALLVVYFLRQWWKKKKALESYEATHRMKYSNSTDQEHNLIEL